MMRRADVPERRVVKSDWKSDWRLDLMNMIASGWMFECISSNIEHDESNGLLLGLEIKEGTHRGEFVTFRATFDGHTHSVEITGIGRNRVFDIGPDDKWLTMVYINKLVEILNIYAFGLLEMQGRSVERADDKLEDVLFFFALTNGFQIQIKQMTDRIIKLSLKEGNRDLILIELSVESGREYIKYGYVEESLSREHEISGEYHFQPIRDQIRGFFCCVSMPIKKLVEEASGKHLWMADFTEPDITNSDFVFSLTFDLRFFHGKDSSTDYKTMKVCLRRVDHFVDYGYTFEFEGGTKVKDKVGAYVGVKLLNTTFIDALRYAYSTFLLDNGNNLIRAVGSCLISNGFWPTFSEHSWDELLINTKDGIQVRMQLTRTSTPPSLKKPSMFTEVQRNADVQRQGQSHLYGCKIFDGSAIWTELESSSVNEVSSFALIYINMLCEQIRSSFPRSSGADVGLPSASVVARSRRQDAGGRGVALPPAPAAVPSSRRMLPLMPQRVAPARREDENAALLPASVAAGSHRQDAGGRSAALPSAPVDVPSQSGQSTLPQKPFRVRPLRSFYEMKDLVNEMLVLLKQNHLDHQIHTRD